MLFSDNYWPGKRPGIRQSIYGWQTIVISLDPFMHDSICRGLFLLHDIMYHQVHLLCTYMDNVLHGHLQCPSVLCTRTLLVLICVCVFVG